MTEFRVTYWRDLPSLVTAREGEHTAKAALDARFMVAIDEAAMRLGATGSDAYLDGSNRSDWTSAHGTGAEVCDRVVADLEAEWTPERLTAYLDDLGPAQ